MPSPKPVSTAGTCGCTGVHPASSPLPVYAATSEASGKTKNTIREELVAIGCWKLGDSGFRFGSSFVSPDTKPDFTALVELATQFPGARLSVFGHADPVGDDTFNKSLSGNRARSVYAILVRDVAAWESLYLSGGSQGWGQSCIDDMLGALGFSSVTAFQTHANLTADGVAGPMTRAKLFPAYMDFLCPRVWSKGEFLGGGLSANGKGDYQGCGEFNPYLVFSQAEEQEFLSNATERNAQNAVNRRVVIFLFRPGMTVGATRWPCPAAAEGTAGCLKRFWSDGAARRAPQATRREYGETQNTFACRFYDRLASQSPCEGVEPKFIELVIPLEADLDGDPEHPDCVRLTEQSGLYSAELTEGSPDVVPDGENPLNYYYFHQVPPGLYNVEVKVKNHWSKVIIGLQVSLQGASFRGHSFEAETKGEQMGTPAYYPADQIAHTVAPDVGCC